MIDFVCVGNKITRYRKAAHMTQDDLANQLFVTRQLVSKWENGTGVPSIDTILSLSRLFHVSFEELLCLEDEASFDEDNIFHGHDRGFVIHEIIEGRLKVSLPDIFYQLSNDERMLILRAVKTKRIQVNYPELRPKLTPREQMYMEARQ